MKRTARETRLEGEIREALKKREKEEREQLREKRIKVAKKKREEREKEERKRNIYTCLILTVVCVLMGVMIKAMM